LIALFEEEGCVVEPEVGVGAEGLCGCHGVEDLFGGAEVARGGVDGGELFVHGEAVLDFAGFLEGGFYGIGIAIGDLQVQEGDPDVLLLVLLAEVDCAEGTLTDVTSVILGQNGQQGCTKIVIQYRATTKNEIRTSAEDTLHILQV